MARNNLVFYLKCKYSQGMFDNEYFISFNQLIGGKIQETEACVEGRILNKISESEGLLEVIVRDIVLEPEKKALVYFSDQMEKGIKTIWSDEENLLTEEEANYLMFKF